MRELMVTRLEPGPLDAREVGDAVEAAGWAARRLVRELGAPAAVVEAVCGAALETVRGHGGETARGLTDAARVAAAILEELARERVAGPA
ncbi:MAG: hypothetical protein ACREMB_13630, partial [Candidatus Rokuibacteriota bacterium]